MADVQVRVIGLFIHGAAGGWCLFAGIRFFRRPNRDHAIAVCRPAGVVVFLLAVGLATGSADRLGSIHPLMLPVIGVSAAAAFYFLGLVPIARRAYPEAGDEYDAAAGSDRADDRPGGDTVLPGGAEQTPRVFVPTEAYYREVRRRFLPLAILICVLAIGGGLLLGGGESPDWSSLLVVGIGGLLLMGGAMAFGARRQLRSLATLRIELNDDGIRRTQAGHPPLAVRFDEISQLVDVPGKGLLVIGRGKYDQLFLTRHLSGFEMLRDRLAEVRPIEAGRSASHRIYGWLLLVLLGVVGGLAVVFQSTNPILVTVAASLLFGMLVWGHVSVARNPHVDRRMKSGLWVLVVVGLVLALRMKAVW